jgi:all-trans-retinol 13,14-reductase
MEDVDAPFGYVGISFPSEKDRSYADRHPGKSTCVMIVGDVPWEWFQEWEDATIHKRGEEYKAFKQRLQDRMLEVLYRNYPQLKGKVAYVDSGSPLDTKFYLGKSHGESYGIKANVAKAKADVTWNRSVFGVR